MKMSARVYSRLALAALATLACACSAPSEEATAPDTSRPGLHGTAVQFPTLNRISGATVTALGRSATTAANGRFSLDVAVDTPFVYTIDAADHFKFVSQEMIVHGPFQQEPSFVLMASVVPALKGGLPGLDEALGVVSVTIYPRGSCAEETGATVSVAPEGAAKITYADDYGLPDPAVTSAAKNQFVVLYNVPLGVELTVRASHPTCRMGAFPYVDPAALPQAGAVTYTGKGFRATESLAAGAVTFGNLYLE